MKTSKERVALFLPGLYEGGAERSFLNLSQGIAARGYAVDLVLARAEGPYMEQIPDAVRVVDLKAPRVLRSTSALARYLQNERPTGLLSSMFANIVAVWGRCLSGVPLRLIINEQNTLSSIVKSKKDIRWKIYPKLADWFYPRADHITTVSKAVADDLGKITAVPRERIQVVHNPVVTPELQKKSEAVLDHPWFMAGEPPVILSVGRLTEQKAFDVLIKAFSQLRKKRPARLLILGEGEDRSMLESLIKQLGLEPDVSLSGFVQNPYPYMARASLFVLPSRWEGLPTVLIEALYLGARIVATDCPGGSREILKDGKYGRLVPVDGPQMLAETMENALDSDGPCPPKESWAPYSLDFIMDHYLSLLLGV